MPAPDWAAWVLFAAVLFAAPVLLRLLAGDDEPDNAVTHESGDVRQDEDEPGGMLAAT
jgi:hypothetical protein